MEKVIKLERLVKAQEKYIETLKRQIDTLIKSKAVIHYKSKE